MFYSSELFVTGTDCKSKMRARVEFPSSSRCQQPGSSQQSHPIYLPNAQSYVQAIRKLGTHKQGGLDHSLTGLEKQANDVPMIFTRQVIGLPPLPFIQHIHVLYILLCKCYSNLSDIIARLEKSVSGQDVGSSPMDIFPFFAHKATKNMHLTSNVIGSQWIRDNLCRMLFPPSNGEHPTAL